MRWRTLDWLVHLRTVGICLILYAIGLLGFNIWFVICGLAAYLVWRLAERPQEDQSDSEEDGDSADEESSELERTEVKDRTEWINEVLSRIWPNIAEAAESKICDMLRTEKVRGYLRRLGGGHLILDSCNLGESPPRLEAVQIQGVSLDQLILDSLLKFEAVGQVRFTLSLQEEAISITVTNLNVVGNCRIICKPLLMKKPFVAGVCLSFLTIPDIRFELSGDVDRMIDVPSLRHLIHSQVVELVQQRIMFPRGAFFKVQEDLDLHLKSITIPKGVFCFTLIEAKDLKRNPGSMADKNCNPFARLTLAVDDKEHIVHTNTIQNSLNPKWDHQSVLFVDDPSTFSDIVMTIHDANGGEGDDNVLGECLVYRDVIRQVVRKETKYDYWKILDRATQGTARVCISWTGLSATPPKDSDGQAVVLVYVGSVCGVYGTVEEDEESRVPVTQVKLSIGARSCLTRPAGSSQPEFKEKLVLFSNNPTNDDLQIELLTAKDGLVLATAAIELIQLINKEGTIMEDLELKLNSPVDPAPRLKVSVALQYLNTEQDIRDNYTFTRSEGENVFHENIQSDEPFENLPSELNFEDNHSVFEFADNVKDSEANTPRISGRGSDIPTQNRTSQQLNPDVTNSDPTGHIDEQILPEELETRLDKNRLSKYGSDQITGTKLKPDQISGFVSDPDISEETKPPFRRSNTLPLQKVREL